MCTFSHRPLVCTAARIGFREGVHIPRPRMSCGHLITKVLEDLRVDEDGFIDQCLVDGDLRDFVKAILDRYQKESPL